MKTFLSLLLLLSLWLSAPAEEFLLEIDGHNVSVINNGVVFNCGAIIDAILDLECGTVILIEIEDIDGPQYCTCPFDLIFNFTLGPNPYTLQVWRWEYWQEEPVIVWVTEFEITESGFLTPVRMDQSECGGWVSTGLPGDEFEFMSWSAIRSLY